MYMARGDKWVIHRIVSPSPLPTMSTRMKYNAVFRTQSMSMTLFDAATGEMKKTHSYPTSEDFYWYRGQRDGTLYFGTWVYWEGGYPTGIGVSWKTAKWYKCWHGTTRTQVSRCWRRTNRGELQWIVLDEGESVQVYGLNDGQIAARRL